MAVPNRPVGGASIESGWGQVVHDAVVAQDIQVGSASIGVSASTQGSVVVVFPRPFASPPQVVAMIGPSSSGPALAFVAQTAAVTATQMTLRLSGAASTTFSAIPVAWIAIGPRA